MDFMYTALIQPMVPVLDNKKIYKIKTPLKMKIFVCGIFMEGLFSPGEACKT
jgi:hypothetical protein